jgi:hypothetical protein
VPRLALAVIETRLAEWRRLLRSSVTQSRAVLQRVLRGRIVFTPSGQDYTFEAPTRFDKLFAGVVFPPKPASETVGTKSTWRDGGEFDGDYGRLLEAVQKSGKWLASPTGFGAAGALREKRAANRRDRWRTPTTEQREEVGVPKWIRGR